MAFCVSCGTGLDHDSVFCAACGQPVAETDLRSPRFQALGGETVKNIGRASAIIGLIGFMLPWISCGVVSERRSFSGVALARSGAPELWFIPLCMFVAMGLLLMETRSVSKQTTWGQIVTGAGCLSVAVLIYRYAQFRGVGQEDPFGLAGAARSAFHVEIGGILTLLGSAGILVSGLLYWLSKPLPTLRR